MSGVPASQPPQPPTEQVEQALRDASVFHRRGLLPQALEACQKALGLDEWSVPGRELFADVLTDLKRFDEALENYRIAQALDPESPRLEKKLAEAVLRAAERQRMRTDVEGFLASQSEGEKKSALLAGLASAVLPGLGQLYVREYFRGMAFLFLTVAANASLVSVTMHNLTPGAGFQGLLNALLNPPSVWWLLGISVIYLISVIDAVVVAYRGATRSPWDI